MDSCGVGGKGRFWHGFLFFLDDEDDDAGFDAGCCMGSSPFGGEEELEGAITRERGRSGSAF